MNPCILRPAIVNGDKHEKIFWPRFRVLNEYIEVSVVVENSRVEKFKLRFISAATVIFLDQLCVGEFPLWILVKYLQVGMRRRGVEVIVEFLHIFSVIALAISEAEESFFQNQVFAVPKRQRKTKALATVADPRNAILAPAISAAARMVVREIFPGVTARTVILAYGAPLTFGEVRSPTFPVRLTRIVIGETFLFITFVGHRDFKFQRHRCLIIGNGR